VGARVRVRPGVDLATRGALSTYAVIKAPMDARGRPRTTAGGGAAGTVHPLDAKPRGANAPAEAAYSQRPPRHEYVLTRMGQEFVDVLMAMVAWSDRWTAGDAGPPVLYRHSCGKITHVEPHCAACGEILRSGDVDEPGPGLTV
jgi:hypothetical protein